MKKSTYILISFVLLYSIYSCQASTNDHINLSDNYWFRNFGRSMGLIESRVINYHNKIYPNVKDYSWNEDFILVEQKPEKNEYIPLMGEDLFRRFEHYALYKKKPNILSDPFYSKLKGIVEKDSSLYSTFIKLGASTNESANRAIGIKLAERLLVEDDQIKRIYSSKINYWIIIHSKDSIAGPLTREDYLDVKRSLGIPKNLKLNFEE